VPPPMPTHLGAGAQAAQAALNLDDAARAAAAAAAAEAEHVPPSALTAEGACASAQAAARAGGLHGVSSIPRSPRRRAGAGSRPARRAAAGPAGTSPSALPTARRAGRLRLLDSAAAGALPALLHRAAIGAPLAPAVAAYVTQWAAGQEGDGAPVAKLLATGLMVVPLSSGAAAGSLQAGAPAFLPPDHAPFPSRAALAAAAANGHALDVHLRRVPLRQADATPELAAWRAWYTEQAAQ